MADSYYMADVATTTYEIVIGVADLSQSGVVERIVDHHSRLEPGVMASNAMMTAEVVAQTKPAIVIMADDSPGIRGSDVIAEMYEASPRTMIIMLASGTDPSYLRRHEAVFQAVTIMNPAGIRDALDSAVEYLDAPEAAEEADGPSRRKHDRRKHQDWSQVFSERRDQERRT